MFVYDEYNGSLFLVLSGLFHPSKHFSHVLDLELLNA